MRDHASDPRSKYCPWVMTLEQALQNITACEKELDTLVKNAPFMRTKHIRDRLDVARKKHNKRKEKALLTMLRKEYDRKQNRRLRSGFGKQISHPVSRVSLTPPEDEEQDLYTGKEDTERVCSQNIVKRNTAGNSSPFANGLLLEALGFLGEKLDVTEVLEGTFEYPDD